MPRLALEISMSLDGFVAGPNASLEQPLGAGGERLHEWVFPLAAWRKPHGLTGGAVNRDSEVVDEAIESTGAYVMGRRMFGGGEGSWGDEPWEGWWGEDPPFHVPVFVLTHHAREPLAKQGGTTFTFVTDGIESALDQARAAAGDKDVAVAGGADVAQQYLRAGLLDDLQVHVAPLLLGDGGGLDHPRAFELDRVAVADPAAEGQPRNPGRADDAPGGDEAERLGRSVEIEPGRAALGPGDPRLAVDLHPAHLREVDHEAAVADAVAGGIVTAPAHGDLQLVCMREREGRRNVGGPGAPHDHGRAAIDERVEAATRLVVPRVRGREDGAGQGPPQLVQAPVETLRHHFTTRYLR
jgi:dihydrofolate reductase